MSNAPFGGNSEQGKKDGSRRVLMQRAFYDYERAMTGGSRSKRDLVGCLLSSREECVDEKGAK
jgi:hypothetical protein